MSGSFYSVDDAGTPEVIADRYLLLSVLGEGGMGTVYHAHDAHNLRPCALKLQRANRPRAFLRREFNTLARLNHPNCIKVLDYGACADGAFYTMEYLRGGTLADERSWSTIDVVQIALQLLAALDHVHSHQIVHRDVKPENCLLVSAAADTPRVKLCDFGIAREAGVEEVARVGNIVGSARYLSPEQARGETADPRSDLYGLGVVLYELLAGCPPVQGNTGSVMAWSKAHLTQEPVLLDSLAPQVPARVARVVMRLLAKDPAHRYPTAAAAYDDLAAWLGGTGEPAPEHPPLVAEHYLAQPHYVGREAELAQAKDFLRSALSSPLPVRRLLMIEGEAGTGKSSFVNQLLDTAGQLDARLHVASCRPDGGSAYQPVRQLFGDDALHSWIRPEASRETLTVTRGTRTKRGSVAPIDARPGSVSDPAAPGAGGNWAPQALETGRLMKRLVGRLLVRAAKQPCVIVIDDAHWADAQTLALLSACIERLGSGRRTRSRSPRLAVILLHRPATEDSALALLQRRADALAARLAIRLGPLDPQAAAELVASTLMQPGDEGMQRLTHGLTLGRPMSALQLSRRLWQLFRSGGMRWTGAGWSFALQV